MNNYTSSASGLSIIGPASAWFGFEEDPPPNASADAAEVVRWLERRRHEGWFTDERVAYPDLEGWPFKRYLSPVVRNFVREAERTDIRAILAGWREQMIAEARPDARLVVRDPGSGAVAVDNERFDYIDASGWTPACPYFRIRISMTTGQATVVPKDCGTWHCRKCGPKKAAALLERIRTGLLQSGRDMFYISTCSHDDDLAKRMRKRRARSGAEFVWVRRMGGKVFYVSTESMGGTHEPRRSDPIGCDDAVALFRTDILRAPGHVMHDHSAGFPIPPEPERWPATDLYVGFKAKEDAARAVVDRVLDELWSEAGCHRPQGSDTPPSGVSAQVVAERIRFYLDG